LLVLPFGRHCIGWPGRLATAAYVPGKRRSAVDRETETAAGLRT
jgi:hypothetical protein